MGRSCKACNHPRVDELNAELVGGRSCAEVSRLFGLTDDSVRRHYRSHVAKPLAVAEGAVRAATVAALLPAVEARMVTALDLRARWVRVCNSLERLEDACERALTDPANPERLVAPDTEERMGAALLLIKLAAAEQRGAMIEGRIGHLLRDDPGVLVDVTSCTLEELEELTGRSGSGGEGGG